MTQKMSLLVEKFFKDSQSVEVDDAFVDQLAELIVASVAVDTQALSSLKGQHRIKFDQLFTHLSNPYAEEARFGKHLQLLETLGIGDNRAITALFHQITGFAYSEVNRKYLRDDVRNVHTESALVRTWQEYEALRKEAKVNPPSYCKQQAMPVLLRVCEDSRAIATIGYCCLEQHEVDLEVRKAALELLFNYAGNPQWLRNGVNPSLLFHIWKRVLADQEASMYERAIRGLEGLLRAESWRYFVRHLEEQAVLDLFHTWGTMIDQGQPSKALMLETLQSPRLLFLQLNRDEVLANFLRQEGFATEEPLPGILRALQASAHSLLTILQKEIERADGLYHHAIEAAKAVVNLANRHDPATRLFLAIMVEHFQEQGKTLSAPGTATWDDLIAFEQGTKIDPQLLIEFEQATNPTAFFHLPCQGARGCRAQITNRGGSSSAAQTNSLYYHESEFSVNYWIQIDLISCHYPQEFNRAHIIRGFYDKICIVYSGNTWHVTVGGEHAKKPFTDKQGTVELNNRPNLPDFSVLKTQLENCFLPSKVLSNLDTLATHEHQNDWKQGVPYWDEMLSFRHNVQYEQAIPNFLSKFQRRPVLTKQTLQHLAAWEAEAKASKDTIPSWLEMLLQLKEDALEFDQAQQALANSYQKRFCTEFLSNDQALAIIMGNKEPDRHLMITLLDAMQTLSIGDVPTQEYLFDKLGTGPQNWHWHEGTRVKMIETLAEITRNERLPRYRGERTIELLSLIKFREETARVKDAARQAIIRINNRNQEAGGGEMMLADEVP
jgi:hypothetical protein